MKSYEIAIQLPQAIRTQLSRLCFGLPNVEWIEQENFHINIRSLGHLDGALYLDIIDSISQIDLPPFHLFLQGVGFKKNGSVNALWVGVGISAPLDELRSHIRKLLKEFDVENEEKGFYPNIVIGSGKRIPDVKLAAWLEDNIYFQTASFPVASFALISTTKTDKTLFSTEESAFQLKLSPKA